MLGAAKPSVLNRCLQIYGHAVACHTAQEMLQDIVSSVCTRTITVSAPGITRFLLEEDCQMFLSDMEEEFQVCMSIKQQPLEPLAEQVAPRKPVCVFISSLALSRQLPFSPMSRLQRLQDGLGLSLPAYARARSETLMFTVRSCLLDVFTLFCFLLFMLVDFPFRTPPVSTNVSIYECHKDEREPSLWISGRIKSDADCVVIKSIVVHF